MTTKVPFSPQCCAIEISGQVLAFLPLVLLRTFHELKIHFSIILVYNVILAALIGALLTSFCTLMYTVVFNHLRNNCDLAQDFIHKHRTILTENPIYYPFTNMDNQSF